MSHDVVRRATDHPVLVPVDRALFHQAGNVIDTAIGVLCETREVRFLIHVLHGQFRALLGVVLVEQINDAFRAGHRHAGQMIRHQVVGKVTAVRLDLVRQMQHERGPELCQFLGAFEGRFHLGISLRVHAAVIGLAIVVSLKDFRLMDFVHIHALAFRKCPRLIGDGVTVAKIDLPHMVGPVITRHLQAFQRGIVGADGKNGTSQHLANRFSVVVGAGQQRGLRNRHKARRVHDGGRRFLTGGQFVDLG